MLDYSLQNVQDRLTAIHQLFVGIELLQTEICTSLENHYTLSKSKSLLKTTSIKNRARNLFIHSNFTCLRNGISYYQWKDLSLTRG